MISVLSLEGRYHKCHEWAQRTRDIYDIVLRMIKLISPRPDGDNLFITHFCLVQGKKILYFENKHFTNVKSLKIDLTQRN